MHANVISVLLKVDWSIPPTFNPTLSALPKTLFLLIVTTARFLHSSTERSEHIDGVEDSISLTTLEVGIDDFPDRVRTWIKGPIRSFETCNERGLNSWLDGREALW